MNSIRTLILTLLMAGLIRLARQTCVNNLSSTTPTYNKLDNDYNQTATITKQKAITTNTATTNTPTITTTTVTSATTQTTITTTTITTTTTTTTTTTINVILLNYQLLNGKKFLIWTIMI